MIAVCVFSVHMSASRHSCTCVCVCLSVCKWVRVFVHVCQYLTIFSYSFSFPFESFHFLKATDASTFAGDDVLGSFNREMILRRIVLDTATTTTTTTAHSIEI